MALNDLQTKINFDQVSDNPQLARGEFADNVDVYNGMVVLLKTIATLNIGDGVKDDGAGNLDLDLATNKGLEIIASQLAAKVGTGNKLTAAGIEMAINELNPVAPDLAADWLPVYDTSAGGIKKVQAEKLVPESLKTNMEVFTANGTWTKPDGVTEVIVEAVGGGGAGAGEGTTGSTNGGGGGGGAFIRAKVTVAGNISVTIGQGGVGLNDANGPAGTDTTFGTAITAKAGQGGTRGDEGGAGGSGGSESLTVTTGTLIEKAPGVSGDSGSGTQGGGKNGHIKGVENNGTALNTNGLPGISLGSGGGGVSRTAGGSYLGGNGKAGYIIVWW